MKSPYNSTPSLNTKAGPVSEDEGSTKSQSNSIIHSLTLFSRLLIHRKMPILPRITALIAFFISLLAPVTGLNLNITAVGAQNGASTLECWTMDTPFSLATIPGIAGSASIILGNVTDFTYVVIPPGLDAGLHHAPVNQ